MYKKVPLNLSLQNYQFPINHVQRRVKTVDHHIQGKGANVTREKNGQRVQYIIYAQQVLIKFLFWSCNFRYVKKVNIASL